MDATGEEEVGLADARYGAKCDGEGEMVDEALTADVDDGHVKCFEESTEGFAGDAVWFECAVVVGLGIEA